MVRASHRRLEGRGFDSRLGLRNIFLSLSSKQFSFNLPSCKSSSYIYKHMYMYCIKVLRLRSNRNSDWRGKGTAGTCAEPFRQPLPSEERVTSCNLQTQGHHSHHRVVLRTRSAGATNDAGMGGDSKKGNQGISRTLKCHTNGRTCFETVLVLEEDMRIAQGCYV